MAVSRLSVQKTMSYLNEETPRKKDTLLIPMEMRVCQRPKCVQTGFH